MTALMPMGRVLRAYLTEARYESLRFLRAPAFALPFLLLPVALYLFFSVLLAGGASAGNPQAATYIFTGFVVVGIMGPALFGFGIFVAQEREQHVLTLKRALPMPPGAYVFGKMCMAMAVSAIVIATLVLAAIVYCPVRFTLAQFATVTAIGLIGTLPFCAIGLFIGTSVSARSAPAWVNLAHQPMIYLSSLFFRLPKSIELVTLGSPAFHLNQLAVGAAGIPSALGTAMHVAVLIGVTVLFTGLALRRLSRVA